MISHSALEKIQLTKFSNWNKVIENVLPVNYQKRSNYSKPKPQRMIKSDVLASTGFIFLRVLLINIGQVKRLEG